MRKRAKGENELRLADLSTFLGIVRFGSISAAARGLKVTPSQVSKAVNRLETQLGVKLLSRSSRGVGLSDGAQRLIPHFEAVLERVRGFYSMTPTDDVAAITVAASAFLSAVFIPRIAARQPDLRLRSLELPPGMASAYAGDGFFDMALTVSPEPWPASWESVRVGDVRRALFGSPALAARLGGGAVAPARLRDIPFIGPIYSYQGLVIPGDDGCPLSFRERRIGHETQTVALACELAQSVEQLVFAPVIAAQPFVATNRLVEIPVQGWNVREQLFLACHTERVRARIQREVLDILRTAIA